MALLTGVSETTRTAMENLLDTFTGADGGGRYVLFCSLIKELDRRSKDGDEYATQMLTFVHYTSRLIDEANRS